MRWYVYQVVKDGKVAYIGKGTKSRYLVSARERGGIAGILEFFKSEAKAIRREIELIATLKPHMNRTKGGEGKTNRRDMTAYWEKKWTREAYELADRNRNYFTLLVAAAYAKCSLSSGEKDPEAESRLNAFLSIA